MFEGSEFPKSLDEDQFDLWLEKGRKNKIKYEFLLVIWDEFEQTYFPAFLESRDEFASYDIERNNMSQEKVVAAYDLYSESRLSLSKFQNGE